MAPVNLGKVGGNQWLHALDHIRSIHISPVPCGGQRCIGKAQFKTSGWNAVIQILHAFLFSIYEISLLSQDYLLAPRLLEMHRI